MCSGTVGFRQKWDKNVNEFYIWLPCKTAVIPDLYRKMTSTHGLISSFPWTGHSASRWPIAGDWHDRIFHSRLLQGVDSHVLLQQPLIYCHFANGGQDPCYTSEGLGGAEDISGRSAGWLQWAQCRHAPRFIWRRHATYVSWWAVMLLHKSKNGWVSTVVIQ